MTKSMLLGIGVAFCSLLFAACQGSGSGTRHDAGPDSRDGGADRTAGTGDTAEAGDAVADAGPDATSPPDAADGLHPSADLPPDTVVAPPPADARDLAGDEAASLPDAPLADDVPTTPAPDAKADDAGDTAPLPDDALADTALSPVDAAVDLPARDANAATFTITVAPNRSLDLVFMLDNSPSMAPKQAKLKAQFPKLIDALKDPSDGTLPDLRLALIDSDLGTGAAYPNGSCGPKTLPDGTQSSFGDLGRFQMIGATSCGVTDSAAQWLEYRQGLPLNYQGDIDSVFTCLAGNLGSLGCGEEHSLQAFEFALMTDGIGNEAQRAMLRPNAYLGLVFLTDEEDCSAAPADGLFGDKPELRGESASLRCSTRSHACGGVNLTSAPPGYPTTQSFSAPLSTCAARTDDCPSTLDGASGTDTSVPTACSPLRGVKSMADELKVLKARPDEQILVAGIFGWPLDESDLTTATYKIAPIPNPNTADTQHPTVFDVWPICYDPSHLPVHVDGGGAGVDGGVDFDVNAAGWGATPGLRLAAFVDQFGDNGMKFSICQPDFAAALSKIGATLAKKSPNLCLPARSDGYVGCTAHFLVPDGTGHLIPEPTDMPQCSGGQTNRPCYRLVHDASRCAGTDLNLQIFLAGDAGVDGGAAQTPGTMLEFTCG
jgi:hypothetical protein